MLFDAALAVESAAAVVVDVDPLAASPFPPDAFCPDVDVVAPAAVADPEMQNSSLVSGKIIFFSFGEKKFCNFFLCNQTKGHGQSYTMFNIPLGL